MTLGTCAAISAHCGNANATRGHSQNADGSFSVRSHFRMEPAYLPTHANP